MICVVYHGTRLFTSTSTFIHGKGCPSRHDGQPLIDCRSPLVIEHIMEWLQYLVPVKLIVVNWLRSFGWRELFELVDCSGFVASTG